MQWSTGTLGIQQEEYKFKGFLQVKCECMNMSNLWYACVSTSITPTLAFGLNVSPVWRAVAMCFTSSLRIPSSRSCFGSTLIIPTSVLFIIKMPSVKMETEWVSFATYRKRQSSGSHTTCLITFFILWPVSLKQHKYCLSQMLKFYTCCCIFLVLLT